MKFTWDTEKNKANIKKHKVSFDEAKTVFYDNNALYEYDEDHSIDEDRFKIIGISYKDRTLIVSHCVRNGSIIRIISARVANEDESLLYYKRIGGAK